MNDNELKSYTVSLAVNGRYYAHVKAASPAEAIRMANDAFTEADIGELETVDWHTVHVEDPDGNFLDPDDIEKGKT